MRSRIITIILISIIGFNLFSCKTNSEVLEKKFEKYTTDTDVVAVLDNSIFYFDDHTLNLRDLVEGEDPNNGYLFLFGKLYFSTSRQNAMNDFSFFVYECDTFGNNKRTVFEKHGYKTKPLATGNQGVLYLEYYNTNTFDDSAHAIASFDICTEEYRIESTGKDTSLSNYKKVPNEKYFISVNDGVLTITDTENNESYNIGKELLLGSDFGEALTDLDYTFSVANVTDNDRIYLVYRINSNGAPYPHFICEYKQDTNQIEFKFLFFASDTLTIEVESIDS